MKRFLAGIAVLVCASGMLPAADRQLVGLMMPDAKLLAGASVAQLRNSPYGLYLLTQGPMNDPNFQQFVQATGFDPTRDVTEIVAASADLQSQSGLLAARGTFDIAHILAYAKTTGVQVDESHGVPILASPDGKGSIAFLDATLVVIGDPDNVTAAVARKSNPSTLDPALTAKATALSATQDAWAVSTMAVPVAGAPGGSSGLNFSALQNLQQSSGGVKFGASVTVTAELVADTPQDAGALAALVQMLAALGQTNPQTAQMSTVLETLTVQTKGSTVSLSLAIPEGVLEQLVPTQAPVRMHKVSRERK